MINKQPKHKYSIELPAATVNEVIEWFENMDTNGELANSLIELVYERIKTGKSPETSNCSINTQNEAPELTANHVINHNDFFDNLYDWQGSSSAAFKEEIVEREVKKTKKKMLYV